MKRRLLLISALASALAFFSVAASALPTYIEQPEDATGVFAIYSGTGVPLDSESWTWHEQTTISGSRESNHLARNIVIPTVTMFKPAEGRASGASVIVAPGGAFYFLAIDGEGYDVARWLAQLGVTAFVLRYRVAHTPEDDAELPAFRRDLFVALRHRDSAGARILADEKTRERGAEDGRRAIRFVRHNATAWGLDPKRIGIMGFSAGGWIAMAAAMQHDAESRPDFACVLYAGYRAAIPVPQDAPPLFLAIANDDKIASPIAATYLYRAWHAAGKPVELHIFAGGGHGFGVKKRNQPSDAWTGLYERWLKMQGVL